jgi:hypothetical protein
MGLGAHHALYSGWERLGNDTKPQAFMDTVDDGLAAQAATALAGTHAYKKKMDAAVASAMFPQKARLATT